jgi:hypothetical protein
MDGRIPERAGALKGFVKAILPQINRGQPMAPDERQGIRAGVDGATGLSKRRLI